MSASGYITVIGGSNADISGFPHSCFSPHDSNPGRIVISAGGVGRNIAENISRLGCRVKLFSAVGSDSFGQFLLEQSRSAGIDTESIIVADNVPTSVYLCIMDEKNELEAAVSDMEIMRCLSPELINQNKELLQDSFAVVIDNNISPDAIAAVKQAGCRQIIFDAVSGKKLSRSIEEICDIDCVKLNSIEAELLSGISLSDTDAPERKAIEDASEKITARGIKHVFITLGACGAHYRCGEDSYHSSPFPLQLRNTTGAGDAFIAGATAGLYRGKTGQTLLNYATACAAAAAASEKTVSEKITHQYITNILNGEHNELQ